MMTTNQDKGPAKQVRMRVDKAKRVEQIALKATSIRCERLDAVDIYDEILEKELPKYEKKYGVATESKK
jgi:hypothetical protein